MGLCWRGEDAGPSAALGMTARDYLLLKVRGSGERIQVPRLRRYAAPLGMTAELILSWPEMFVGVIIG
jgi:hypothetical protein